MKKIIFFVQTKKLHIIAALAGASVLTFFLFPIVASVLLEPYVITLRYSVRTEGIYTLKFHRYIWLDPGTTFLSSVDDRMNVSIKNVGDAPATCWISNYQFTPSEALLDYYQPVLDQQASQYHPGRLLDEEGSLGWALQPYRTFHLEPDEAMEVSFHGHERTVECQETSYPASLLFGINNKLYPQTFADETNQFKIINEEEKEQKKTTIIVPAYAFGTYDVMGPEGFNIINATVKHSGNNRNIPYGSIAFPLSALIFSLVTSLLLIFIFAYLINHLVWILRQYPMDGGLIRQVTPFFSGKDFSFLLISGTLIFTFTGSVPPIHMLDSVYYVDTASELSKLLSTFMYPPYRSPGYMIFIWLTKSLMGPGYGLILVQQALFFVTAFLVFKTVEHFTHGKGYVAWIAALLYLLNPINLIFSQFIQPEGLWRDLIVFWAFSLVLLLRKNRYASACGGIALGLLWLSRSSALPSIILMVCASLLIAWGNVSLKRHLIITASIIVLLYSPYFIYLRLAGTKSLSYYAAFHHSLSFLFFDRTLDTATPCFKDFRLDFYRYDIEKLPYAMPWMQTDVLYSPLNERDATVNESVSKATQFERCVYQANYLRFPKQQLAKLADRILKYIWSDELRDRDVWDYSRVYSNDFIPETAVEMYHRHGAFTPYYYSEKWNVQDAQSLWKNLFNVLYVLWPYVNFAIVVFSALSTFFLHYHVRRGEYQLFRKVLPVSTAFLFLYLADAVMYSVFGVIFPVRMMVAVWPLLLLAVGINMGVIIDWVMSKSRVTSPATQ
jgi:hypothetical protein